MSCAREKLAHQFEKVSRRFERRRCSCDVAKDSIYFAFVAGKYGGRETIADDLQHWVRFISGSFDPHWLISPAGISAAQPLVSAVDHVSNPFRSLHQSCPCPAMSWSRAPKHALFLL